MDRRKFFKQSAGIGAGVVAAQMPSASLLSRKTNGSNRPIILTSHSNETGQNAVREAWSILSTGGSALDAVEKGANVIEVDPEDTSVGYGGLPNELGVVQLDASIMDGRTYNAGSVASIEGIKTPSSIARLVMERTDHVMLVGPAAGEFARSFGYEHEELLTDKARQIWLRWRERHSNNDDWGPAEHLVGLEEASRFVEGPMEFHYGTTNVLAVDSNGDISGITTTSGLSWKVPGRIGDSPIIGAGLYVDNKVGAAGATGRGEDVIKSCATYYIVMRMAAGRSPQEACQDAIEMIVDKYSEVNPNFVPPEKFVALNKDGDYGCAWMGIGGTPRMSVHTEAGVEVFQGTALYSPSE